MLTKQYGHKVNGFICGFYLSNPGTCLHPFTLIPHPAPAPLPPANSFRRLLALRYVNKTLWKGGEPPQLRVSGKVSAEDLDVLVNTLILCKLSHKRRTSCCISEADKHGGF